MFWSVNKSQEAEKRVFFSKIGEKIAFLWPNMSKKPKAPLEPPDTMKFIFLRWQDMNTLCLEEEFLNYLP